MSAHTLDVRASLCLRYPLQLGELEAGGSELAACPCLDHPAEVDHALAERVKPLARDDRMTGDTGLAAACRDLGNGLARERLLVDLPLAGRDPARAAHQCVEPHRVEHI